MKEYKRLTKRKEDCGWELEKCNQCSHCEVAYCDNAEDAITRLAELEDKIENGTLIELPCKVGDKIWYVSHIRIEKDRAINILEEWDVEKIDIYDYLIICRLTHKGTDHYNTAREDEFGEMWFTTKAEAEAKFKELQNER